jgi:hypothetical protein
MSGSCDCNDLKKFYYFISENKGYAYGLGALIDSWTPLVTFWESKKSIGLALFSDQLEVL